MTVESRYFDGGYLAANPDWDRSDAPWKAAQVASILSAHGIMPKTMCEIGCGAGDILVRLQQVFPQTALTGFDISPHVEKFWKEHQASNSGIVFKLADFANAEGQPSYDVLLMLDVFEHVRDPFSFLESARSRAKYFVFHIPLDLSASSVLRGTPLLNVRDKVGHLHYYTKDLALRTLTDTGYEVIDWRYTEASFNSPGRSLKAKLASLPRRIAYGIHKDWGVRLLGGETLLVLAKAAGS